jgi:hypothetical protein
VNLLHHLARRSPRRAFIVSFAAGWLCVVVAAIVDGSPLLVVGGALVGVTAVALTKVTLESIAVQARTARVVREHVRFANQRDRTLVADLKKLDRRLAAHESALAGLRSAIELQHNRRERSLDIIEQRVEELMRSQLSSRRHVERTKGRFGELGLRDSLDGLAPSKEPTRDLELPTSHVSSVDSAMNDPGAGGSMSANG